MKILTKTNNENSVVPTQRSFVPQRHSSSPRKGGGQEGGQAPGRFTPPLAPPLAGRGTNYSWNAFVLVFFLLFTYGSVHASKIETHTPEDAILAQAFSAYMDGKDQKALSYFEEVVRINPKNAAAL